MTNAVEVVISGSMGYLRASEQFGNPQTTLESSVKEKSINPVAQYKNRWANIHMFFTCGQEAEFVTYVKSRIWSNDCSASPLNK
jgi:hypothetical protein